MNDLRRLLQEEGFQKEGEFWVKFWRTSFIHVFLGSKFVEVSRFSPDGEFLSNAVVPSDAEEVAAVLGRMSAEADYLDAHGRRQPYARTLHGYDDEGEEYPRVPERIFGPGLDGLLEDAEERRAKKSCAGDSLPEYRLALAKSRCVRGAPTGARLATPTAVGDFLAKHFGCQPQEQFLALGLDPRSTLLGVLDIGTGGIDTASVDPRVLFAGLVLMGASAVIICHVHPSGDPTPSVQDMGMTRQLKQGAEMLSIRLLDHIVIAPGGKMYSMSQAGTL